eukprot:CAMPEP_0173395596 /NCGR_PEP_ID=MMETSP1356-20130122/32612_1 /TAXON_ID=77927 ORGANISM="Hemiselmis virescens, Strain PCC157" /NCGR_SAMPLE_ID=MMETSP1356 /ASSEMBLY_ACC=CAM_ASM_000847 /LENGTH=272 /DNA_ID=CAMNT_0014354377 /DNA_START=148 /DNA_END=963 /DNA_ORIENTATION=+
MSDGGETDRGQTSITDYYAATFRKANSVGGLAGGKQQQQRPKAPAQKAPLSTSDAPANPTSNTRDGNDVCGQTRTLLLQRLDQALAYTEARGASIASVCQPLKPSNRHSEGQIVCRSGRSLAPHLQQLPSLLASRDVLDAQIACDAVSAASRNFARASLLPLAGPAQQACSPPAHKRQGGSSPLAALVPGNSNVMTRSLQAQTDTLQRAAPPPQQQQPATHAAAAAVAGRGEAAWEGEADKKKAGKRTASAAGGEGGKADAAAVWEDAASTA